MYTTLFSNFGVKFLSEWFKCLLSTLKQVKMWYLVWLNKYCPFDHGFNNKQNHFFILSVSYFFKAKKMEKKVLNHFTTISYAFCWFFQRSLKRLEIWVDIVSISFSSSNLFCFMYFLLRKRNLKGCLSNSRNL